MWLFAAFVFIPIIEIALFIKVGGLIGLLPTLAIVLGTAVAGTMLMRAPGAAAMADLRVALSEMRDPTEPIAHGAMILLAGALLITPGFFTDTLGLLLLIPAVRLAVLRYLAQRVTVARFSVGPQPGAGGTTAPHRPDVIDGEFIEIDPDEVPRRRGSADRSKDAAAGRPGGGSGWTRH